MALTALALTTLIVMAAGRDAVADARGPRGGTSAVGLTQPLEDQVAAHQVSHEQAIEQLRKAAPAIQ
jgi:hypothetical protein